MTWSILNRDNRQRLERAVFTGDNLFQTYIDRTVQMLTLRELGLISVLPKIQGSGDKIYVRNRTPNATLAEWQQFDASGSSSTAEEANATVADGVYGESSFRYMTLQSRGRVTRKAMAVGQSYADVLALEMAAKAEDFAAQLEESFIYGCLGVAQDGSSAANSQPIGLLSLIEGTGASLDDQVLSGQLLGGSDGKTQVLTLSQLDQLIDRVKGSANRRDLAIIGSYAGIRQVNSLLQSTQQFVDQTEINAGFRVRTYDGIPLITSTAIKDTLRSNDSSAGALQGSVKAATGGSATQLFCINLRHVYHGVLTPMTVMPLAKTTSAYDEFDIFEDCTIALSNKLGAAVLNDVSTTGTEQTNT